MMKLDAVGEIPVDPGIWLQKIETLYLLVRSQRELVTGEYFLQIQHSFYPMYMRNSYT